jgi:branched-chain amino acid transport system permease protein
MAQQLTSTLDPSRGYVVETRTRASLAAGLIALIVVAVALALPAFAGRGLLNDLFYIFTMLTLAQLWNLLAGYGGLVSVGQQAFVGIGAYTLFAVGILSGVNMFVGIFLGGLAALILAVPTAFFAFRLQGAYFAIGTWVVAEVTRLLVAQWKALGGGTGTSLPREARSSTWGVAQIESLLDVSSAAAQNVLNYWLALLLLIATVGGIYGLLRSKRGLALAAVRDNVGAARSVGVDAQRIKWTVFLVAAFGTGLCGALIYLQTARISPDAAFSIVEWTAYVVFIVVIGGIGTIEGPIVGVIVLFTLRTFLSDYGTWYLLLLGVLAIIVMLFAPRGIWGLIADRTGLQLFPTRRRLTPSR